MRQFAAAVAFELDTFFEVHEVKLHLLGAARQREVRDDDVEQRGLAGTGFARDERVLASALAEFEPLQFRRAGTPDGHAQFLGGDTQPNVFFRRRNLRERHFDARGIFAAFADAVQKLRRHFRRRRRVQNNLHAGLTPVREFKIFRAAR